jgi:hypothetical protein
MAAYMWTSLPGIPAASGLSIRWIWKTAQSEKRELAIEDDAVRVPSVGHDAIGMRLSPPAREAGWTGVVEGPPERIPSARLRPILADKIFEGQSVWLFVLLPGLIGFGAAIFLLQCLVWLEDWLPEMPLQRQQFPWEDPAPTIFDRCAICVHRVRSLVVRSRRAAAQGTGSHLATTSIASKERKAPHKAKPPALPVFGVQDGSNGRVYVWSERDEID